MTGRFACILVLVIFSGGCAPQDNLADLYPLTGTITREGKVVTSGGLLFSPVSGGTGGVNVDANINKDGTFTAHSSRWSGKETVYRPGIKPGRYKVTFLPATDGAKTGLEVELSTVVVVESKDNQVTLVLPTKLPEGSGEPRDDANPPETPTPKKD